MKKKFYSLFALAALAMASTSCTDELESGVANGNEAEVTFSIQLENAVGSRAVIGDGTTANYLTFAVFKAVNGAIGDEVAALRQYDVKVENLKATVNTTLVKGQTYNFVFWAQSEEVKEKEGKGTYYNISDMSKVKVLYKANNEIDGNQEGRDAFYAIRKDLKVTGPITETITLKRPFGQINVGTKIGSLQAAKTAEVNIDRTKIVLSEMATSLEIYTGKVGDIINNVTFTKINIPEENKYDNVGELKNVGGTDYEYLSMNYILVPDQSKDENEVENGSRKYMLNNAHFYLYDNDNEINNFRIPNVPVQRNWRTNIVGDIMNNEVTFNIVIDPSFDKDNWGEDHNYYANVQTADELKQAVAHGAVVTLTTDITIDEGLSVNKNTVLNLNGKALKFTKEDILFRVQEGAKLQINGGTIQAAGYVASANKGGEVIVDGGNYITSDVTLFQANGGKVYIKDGYFDAQGEHGGKKYVYTLNHIDSEKANGLIEVSGGVFVGYNPANSSSENPAMNFLAAGYETTEVGGVYMVHEAGQNVVLPQDITTLATTIVKAGETFDGNGKTLRMQKNNAQYYMQPTGGVIKDVNIDGYNERNADGKVIRGIYIANATEDVVIDGVNVWGVAYPLNTGGNIASGLTLKVSNSRLAGWTSFSGFASASFEKVNFEKSNYKYGSTVDPTWYASFKPYVETVLTDCNFAEGFTLDLSSLVAGAKVTFKNCKVGSDLIMDQNVETLLNFTNNGEVVVE